MLVSDLRILLTFFRRARASSEAARTPAASTYEPAALRGEHPGTRVPVDEPEGEGVGLLAVEHDDHLVALVLGQLVEAPGDLLLAGDHEDAVLGVALGDGGVQLAPGLVLRERPVLGLDHERRQRRPVAGTDLDDHVALLPARFRRGVAHVMGDVALGCGHGLELVVDQLLEAAALAGAGLLRLGDAAVRRVLLLELDDLTRQLLDPLAVGLALGLVAAAELVQRAHDAALEVGERIRSVLGRELLQQRFPLLLERPPKGVLELALAPIRHRRRRPWRCARRAAGHRPPASA